GEVVFLAQVYHAAPAGTVLGEMRAIVDGAVAERADVVAADIGDRDWQRQLLTVRLSQTSRVSIELEWNGAAKVKTGAIALTKARRPFYHIGHNPNSLEEVDAALAGGANAIEPDLQFENGDLDVREQGNELTNPITGGNVRTDFDEFVRGIADR